EDSTPPKIVSIETPVSPCDPVRVTFSEPVNEESLVYGVMVDDYHDWTWGYGRVVHGATVTYWPALKEGSSYRLFIFPTVTDLAGNKLERKREVDFDTLHEGSYQPTVRISPD